MIALIYEFVCHGSLTVSPECAQSLLSGRVRTLDDLASISKASVDVQKLQQALRVGNQEANADLQST